MESSEGGGLAVGFSLHCVRKADSKEEVGRKSLKALAALSDLRMEVVELKGCLREAEELCVLHVWNLFLWLCKM